MPYSPITIFQYGVNFVSFNANGNLLATASSDGKVYMLYLGEFELNVSKCIFFVCITVG